MRKAVLKEGTKTEGPQRFQYALILGSYESKLLNKGTNSFDMLKDAPTAINRARLIEIARNSQYIGIKHLNYWKGLYQKGNRKVYLN